MKDRAIAGPCPSKNVLPALYLFSVLLNDPYRVARLNLGQLSVIAKRTFHG